MHQQARLKYTFVSCLSDRETGLRIRYRVDDCTSANVSTDKRIIIDEKSFKIFFIIYVRYFSIGFAIDQH